MHFMNVVVILCCLYGIILVDCFPNASPSSKPKVVVITGAHEDVGKLVLTKLLKRKDYTPIGVVPNQKCLKKIMDTVPGCKLENIKVIDITNKQDVRVAFEGGRVNSVVLCTSAKPKLKVLRRIRNFLTKLKIWRKITKKQSKAPKNTDYYYEKNAEPYIVDNISQKLIIDAAVRAKADHIVLLGMMGGYRNSKILDDMARNKGDPDNIGNIMKWKRSTERYLMKRCFFTILHAGTLTDEKGGNAEIVWDTDDSLLRTAFKKISKEDVAEVILQSLLWKEAIGRNIDIGSRPNSKPFKMDWLRFWSMPGQNVYPSDPEN